MRGAWRCAAIGALRSRSRRRSLPWRWMRIVHSWVGSLLPSLSALRCLAPAGCLDARDQSLGEVNINLVGQTPSGTKYVLRGAVITVQGPASQTWNTQDARVRALNRFRWREPARHSSRRTNIHAVVCQTTTTGASSSVA